MTAKELTGGRVFFFNNEEYQVNIGGDDIRIAEVSFSDDLPFNNGFRIEFNGSLIHVSKTFLSMEKRLNKLIADWNLKQDRHILIF